MQAHQSASQSWGSVLVSACSPGAQGGQEPRRQVGRTGPHWVAEHTGTAKDMRCWEHPWWLVVQGLADSLVSGCQSTVKLEGRLTWTSASGKGRWSLDLEE